MRVNIITKVTQPENLPYIASSILKAIQNKSIFVVWYLIVEEEIVFDSLQINTIQVIDNNKVKAINRILDLVDPGFVYFLDGNNILHPQIFEELVPDLKGMIFNQILEDNTLRTVKDENTGALRIRPGAINQSQFLIHTDLIENIRWIEKIDAPDGFFIQEIYSKSVENLQPIKVVNLPLAYHNKLIERDLLKNAPDSLGPGSLVIPQRDFYENNLKKNLNPQLRGTIALISRLCDKKVKIISINGNVVNVIPLRKASPFYKQGRGVLLIFENQDQILGIFKPVVWGS